MATFQIYDKEDSEPVVVKEGFNFMAFFSLGFIWALFNRLWIAGILGGFIWIMANSAFENYLSQFTIAIANILPIEDEIKSIMLATLLVLFIPGFIFGVYGNEMLGSKLTNDGYSITQTIEADNAKKALDEYNDNEVREKETRIKEKETREFFKRAKIKKVRITKHTSAVTKENTAPRKPLPSKISAQTLYIRQKREINRKLKQKLITKKTAEAQLKKAAELEEMRLIIENKGKKPEVKKEVKPKKITSKPKGDFDYVEKIKDITALRDEGAISQAEFNKLKKKIMDTL